MNQLDNMTIKVHLILGTLILGLLCAKLHKQPIDDEAQVVGHQAHADATHQPGQRCVALPQGDGASGRAAMYSEEAKQRRRCTALCKDGQPCRAWACWGDAEQRCMAHAGRHHTGSTAGKPYHKHYPTKYTPCTCAAYQWPHRPRSGICRWPEQPLYRCTTPAGIHTWPRLRGSLAVFKRLAQLKKRRVRSEQLGPKRW